LNRKEEVKHKEENIKKLDEKAVLLNFKKVEEDLSSTNHNGNSNTNELSAANIPTSTSLALHIGEVNNNIIALAPSQEKNEN